MLAGQGGSGAGGSIEIVSGSSQLSDSGSIMIKTQDSSASTGSLFLQTGTPMQVGNGIGGDVNLRTGSGGSLALLVESSMMDNGGDAVVKAGTSTNMQGGDLLLESGS